MNKVLKTLLLSLILTMIAFPEMQTMAAPRKGGMKAYQKFLSKNTITVKEIGKSKKVEPDRFAVIKLNNDKIPELVVQAGLNYYLFTYKKGKVKQVGNSYFGSSPIWTIGYYPGKSILCLNGFAGVGSSYYRYMKAKIKNCTISEIASRIHLMNFVDYRISEKSVGKTAFDRYMAGQTGRTSMKTITFSNNNKKNRQKKLR